MKEKTLKIKCEKGCGAYVDWMDCDDDGQNCEIAFSVQCGHCGYLNLGMPEKPKELWWTREFMDFVADFQHTTNTDPRLLKESDVEVFFRQMLREQNRRGIIEGRELEHKKCSVGCPYYSSEHSIGANGSCNLGCC